MTHPGSRLERARDESVVKWDDGHRREHDSEPDRRYRATVIDFRGKERAPARHRATAADLAQMTELVDLTDLVGIPDLALMPDPVERHDRTPARGRREQHGSAPVAAWMARAGLRPFVFCADLLSCGAAVLLSRWMTPATVAFTVVLLWLYTAAGLYRPRLSVSLLDDLPRLVGRWLVATCVAVLVEAAGAARPETDRAALATAAVAGVAGALVLTLRGGAYAVVRSMRRKRYVAHRTVVLGAGRVGSRLARVLLHRPEYGLMPIGFVDVDPLVRPAESGLPLLGRPEDLRQVLLDHDVRIVVVAFGSRREADVVDALRACDRLRCEIFLVPRLFEVHHVSDDMDTVWGLPLVRLRRATHRSRGWRVKRGLDAAVAAFALVALAPVMAAAALAVRLEGGPGVLFRQERVGADGRRFRLLKFRSLKPVDDAESATRWNVAGDHRMGPVGRFLRRTSIDELPQLINILRGDMSLVGPRPERPHFVETFRSTYPHYGSRHRVPSGLTGLAQVQGLRGDTSIDDRARFDNYYIENWSLWLDMKILLRTIGSVIRGEGA